MLKTPPKNLAFTPIVDWNQRLRQAAKRSDDTTLDSCKALEAIDSAVQEMVPPHSSDSVEWKKIIRGQLWEFRKSSPIGSPPEVRQAYEKLRNLTLDNTAERLARGATIPMTRYTTPPPASDIPNFQALSDTYLRGGQPDQDGLNWLAEAGVKTRIDLRGDDRDNQWNPPQWNPASIKVFKVDVKDYHAPTIAMVEKFIEIAEAPENQPVFVHCKAGVGRTGVMTACMNIARGMTAEQALKQEGINSYHGTLQQEDFVRDFETYWTQKTSDQSSNLAEAS